MSWKAKRKRFTIGELALFYGVHRNTMREMIRKEGTELDDPASVLSFIQSLCITSAVMHNTETQEVGYPGTDETVLPHYRPSGNN
jgi:TctA family transporter